MSESNSLNTLTFHEYSGEDPENIAFMMQLFIEQCDAYTQELIVFFEAKSNQDWHDVAHAFKGMAAFAGADNLYELCLRAEKNYSACPKLQEEILNDILKEVKKTTDTYNQYLKDAHNGLFSK